MNPAYKESVLPINPQLHGNYFIMTAWWHVLISIALYNMALLTLIERVDVLYGPDRCKLKFFCNLIPYVKIEPLTEKKTRSGKIYDSMQKLEI
jgi:hypothetical protein